MPVAQPPGEPRVTGVRPYLITGGRSRPIDSSLQPEAQVLATWDGLAALDRLSYEHHDIVLLCQEPQAVVEVAAHLGLHLGVVRVVVADLVALGYLILRPAESSTHHQTHVIERVIRGLTAIR